MTEPEIRTFIKKYSPFMEESSDTFQELTLFFGEDAKIATDIKDLSRFLGRKRLYRIIRLNAESFKDCVYKLVDDYPESMEALGMLRYYATCEKNIRWEEIENAEIAIGKELTTNAYGWSPDAWTAFTDSTKINEGLTAKCSLTAIIAFDFGE